MPIFARHQVPEGPLEARSQEAENAETRLSSAALSLDRTKVTDKGLKECAKLSKLEDLSLSGLSISGKGLRYLESLKALWNCKPPRASGT